LEQRTESFCGYALQLRDKPELTVKERQSEDVANWLGIDEYVRRVYAKYFKLYFYYKNW